MLTITPPEARDDEIQVEETERDSILLKLSPTRLNAKRKARNAHGFNYIQLIVGMIIFVALSRIVGPPAFRMITRARSTASLCEHPNRCGDRSERHRDRACTGHKTLTSRPQQPRPQTPHPGDGLIAAVDRRRSIPTGKTSWDASTRGKPLTRHPNAAHPTSHLRRGTLAADCCQRCPRRPLTGCSDRLGMLFGFTRKNEDGSWACALIVLKPQTDEN